MNSIQRESIYLRFFLLLAFTLDNLAVNLSREVADAVLLVQRELIDSLNGMLFYVLKLLTERDRSAKVLDDDMRLNSCERTRVLCWFRLVLIMRNRDRRLVDNTTWLEKRKKRNHR